MTTATTILNLSWNDVEYACLDVAHQISLSGFKPTIVLPVLWGGIVPARILIDIMGWNRKCCRPIVARSYVGGEQGKEIHVDIPFCINDPNNQKILIIEEIIDTSRTIRETLKQLETQHGCDETSIEIATLYKRQCTAFRPFAINYHHKTIEDEWIIFPWDKHEYMRSIYK